MVDRENDFKESCIGVDDFTLIKVIGQGSAGKVLMVRCKENNQIMAMKIIKKANMKNKDHIAHAKAERNIMEYVNHPNIVKLNYAFQNLSKLYLVLEYCPGGELFFHLQKTGRFTEEKTRFYAAQIVLALEYLHNKNIVYRDLEPENILLDNDGFIKLTDFGLSKENFENDNTTNSFVGTPEYLAPEILAQNGYGKAVDWWSLGAMIYELLTGLPPFYTRDRKRLFSSILKNELKYPNYLTANATDLLKKLLIKLPDQRLGGRGNDASEIKSHPWFIEIDWLALESKNILPGFQPNIISPTDTTNFDEAFTLLKANDSAEKANSNLLYLAKRKWTDFSYNPS